MFYFKQDKQQPKYLLQDKQRPNYWDAQTVNVLCLMQVRYLYLQRYCPPGDVSRAGWDGTLCDPRALPLTSQRLPVWGWWAASARVGRIALGLSIPFSPRNRLQAARRPRRNRPPGVGRPARSDRQPEAGAVVNLFLPPPSELGIGKTVAQNDAPVRISETDFKILTATLRIPTYKKKASLSRRWAQLLGVSDWQPPGAGDGWGIVQFDGKRCNTRRPLQLFLNHVLKQTVLANKQVVILEINWAGKYSALKWLWYTGAAQKKIQHLLVLLCQPLFH